WILRDEFRSIDEVIEVSLFVRFKLSIKSRLPEHEVLLKLLHVLLELTVQNRCRRSRRTTSKGGSVRVVSQSACRLKFNRQEESRRCVDARHFGAWRRTAVVDVVGPESKTARVRFTVEKIEILLTHKERRRINWIRQRRRDVVVVNR